VARSFVVYFKILFWHSSGGAEENLKNPLLGQTASGPRPECRTSQIWWRNV